MQKCSDAYSEADSAGSPSAAVSSVSSASVSFTASESELESSAAVDAYLEALSDTIDQQALKGHHVDQPSPIRLRDKHPQQAD